MPIGTRRRCLMKKTGHEKSRDTVPLISCGQVLAESDQATGKRNINEKKRASRGGVTWRRHVEASFRWFRDGCDQSQDGSGSAPLPYFHILVLNPNRVSIPPFERFPFCLFLTLNTPLPEKTGRQTARQNCLVVDVINHTLTGVPLG
jgi:hypothetical protein